MRGDPPKRSSVEFRNSEHHQRAMAAIAASTAAVVESASLPTVAEEPRGPGGLTGVADVGGLTSGGQHAGAGDEGAEGGVGGVDGRVSGDGSGSRVGPSAVPRGLKMTDHEQQRLRLEAYEDFCDDWGGSDTVKMQMFKRRCVQRYNSSRFYAVSLPA